MEIIKNIYLGLKTQQKAEKKKKKRNEIIFVMLNLQKSNNAADTEQLIVEKCIYK